MYSRTIWVVLFLFFLMASWSSAEIACIFEEDFEDGALDWTPDPDNGTWQCGSPTSGPGTPAPEGGLSCAATVLDGNYEGYLDSVLISPAIFLPSVGAGETLELRYWEWFSYSSYDSGRVQIGLGIGSWTTLEKTTLKTVINDSVVWSLCSVDLTAYANSLVRVGFYHEATRDGYDRPSESSGWYIDNVRICSYPVMVIDVDNGCFEIEGFEEGWKGWSSTNGIWEVGSPVSGPGTPVPDGGVSCAATVLGGNYAGYTDSMLVSPALFLPAIEADEFLELRYWEWFSYSSYDSGCVQISKMDSDTGSWSDWEDLKLGPTLKKVINNSVVWSLGSVDLTAYANSLVRVGFYHEATRDGYDRPSESSGWYIDEVKVCVVSALAPDVFEGFENGWAGWSATNGIWQIGARSSGEVCEGSSCAATVLDGGYAGYTDSILVSPPIDLSNLRPCAGALLRYCHWHSYSSYDMCELRISSWDSDAASWGEWVSIRSASGVMAGSWDEAVPWNLTRTSYIGSLVRLGFYHEATRDGYDRPSESSGWYIDNIRLEVPYCDCICCGDLMPDCQKNLNDLTEMVNMLVEAGSPFIVPVAPGHCGDLNADSQVDLNDLTDLINQLIEAGSPFVVPCCQ